MNTTFPFQAKLQHWNLVQFVGEYALQWEFDPHKNTVTLFSYHSSTKKMVVLRFNRGSILLLTARFAERGVVRTFEMVTPYTTWGRFPFPFFFFSRPE